MDNGGHSEREGEVMTQVWGGRDERYDNAPTIKPLTAQTGNINVTSALSQNLHLQKGDTGEQEVFHKALFGNTGRGRDEEEEKEGNAEEHIDGEEEDLDEVMKEEDEKEIDASEGSSSLNCCQSPDPIMTDCAYSEMANLLETQYPFSPGTSPELSSPVIAMATPETSYPISQACVCESAVRVKPLTFNNVSVSSRMGSVPVEHSLPPWLEDPATLTSDWGSPSPRDPTYITEHLTPVTQSIREFFTSAPVTFTITANTADLSATAGYTLATAAAGPSLSLGLDSTSARTQCASSRGTLSSNWEPILSSSGPASIIGPMCDTRHVPGQDLLKSLEDLAQRGDDAYLPQYIHKIAEAFVLKKNYHWALWCIQLERLYHQRLLDNLNVLQEQWESQRKPTSSELETRHLDSLKHICQTHSRPRVKDAVCVSWDILRSATEGGGELSPCVSGGHVDGRMETRDKESCHFESNHPILPSCKITDIESPGIVEKREDPERELVGREGIHRSQLTDRGGGKAIEVERCTISAVRNELHTSTSVALEQPGPAEQQGGDLCLAQERLAKREAQESCEKKTVNALKMNVKAEAEEEKVRQRVLQLKAVVSGTDVAQQQLYQEALAEKSQLQESSQGFVYQMVSLPSDDHIKQKAHGEVEDVEDADREASSLDDLAKLITVEEIFPPCGLVSILKRQNETVDCAPMNFRSSKASSKRCVRFKLPDDSYEHDVGGGDSCLVLFLLCLVTVMISLGGTALYCALGDIHSSICQDFTRNADFYMDQIQRGIYYLQNWFGPGS
ncbi:uncharacterized protein cnsta isoform X1 [Takifugu rubripes]|uniref:Uncharacterized protein n=2 Tax=Takifugu rubripes TaxID=31033 RepID=A0A3B5K1Z6_TAKRU|nr:consortin isoform X1 [Takifugu rubripes]|eukprot:XP_011607932.1 PREDICTED: consortin isoform X1 [Takifugu rubripes]